jgi:two-component system, NtrC family, nitrogen regulation sensor histidine kinase NtrY
LAFFLLNICTQPQVQILKLRTRIILAMTALMLVSLLVIGAVTVFFFHSQNEQYHQERLARKERAIKTEMAYFSQEEEMQKGLDIVIKEFEEEVIRQSAVHNLEINIYDTRGYMIVSARPEGLHSEYMDRRVPQAALEQLQQVDRIVLKEARDSHEYLSDYTVLRNAKGERLAILNLPYEQDEAVQQNDLPEFLGSIGITYFFLFLGAIGLTVLFSNSITKDFSILSDRMEAVDLNANNEPIEWNQDDDIGRLIMAYNDMLAKLSESRDLLAKKEREEAWREMARQIAHEIKNPLTPIKLSVQHLQATSDFSSERWQSKFKNTMAMIIQQTESLNKIASEFGDFAKIPKPSEERVLLTKVIDDVIILFSDTPTSINLINEDGELETIIDQDALRRVLGNLIKNANQALVDTDRGAIEIRLHRFGDKARIEIADNGPGVRESLKSKIFQPNFTTKSSGTGLGLAICQQIIEQAKGKIWLEDNEPTGARFVVELPLASTNN